MIGGMRVQLELSSTALFKGQEIMIFMHDGEQNQSRNKVGIVHLVVDDFGNFVVETSDNLKPTGLESAYGD